MKSPALRQIATERRKITRDDSDILERLIEERYDWLPADVAAGLRRRHLGVFVALWWRCEAEVRSAIAWRRAVRESGALKNAALGYWLLARFALAAASKLAGRAAIDNRHIREIGGCTPSHSARRSRGSSDASASSSPSS